MLYAKATSVIKLKRDFLWTFKLYFYKTLDEKCIVGICHMYNMPVCILYTYNIF